MPSPNIEAAVRQAAFRHYLRTGTILGADTRQELAQDCERKFNPNHDPVDGRFTSGPSGADPHTPASKDPARRRFYKGRTVRGEGVIEPTSGGYVDANGHYVAEAFAPDPYSSKDPAAALAHYVDGSGAPMNVYMGSVDTSALDISKFHDIRTLLDAGTPGSYAINDAVGGLDTGRPLTISRATQAAVIGRMSVSASGTLNIGRDGSYHFSGWLGGLPYSYRFHESTGRTPEGSLSNAIGSTLRGRPFVIYKVGTVPFNASGRR